MAPPITDPPHGLKRYKHRIWKCRCGVCRRANTMSMRERRGSTLPQDAPIDIDVQSILDDILKDV